jgi:hypothetical protein
LAGGPGSRPGATGTGRWAGDRQLELEEAGGVEDEDESDEEPEEVFVAAPSGVLDFPSDFASEDVGDDGFSASIAFFRDSEG